MLDNLTLRYLFTSNKCPQGLYSYWHALKPAFVMAGTSLNLGRCYKVGMAESPHI